MQAQDDADGTPLPEWLTLLAAAKRAGITDEEADRAVRSGTLSVALVGRSGPELVTASTYRDNAMSRYPRIVVVARNTAAKWAAHIKETRIAAERAAQQLDYDWPSVWQLARTGVASIDDPQDAHKRELEIRASIFQMIAAFRVDAICDVRSDNDQWDKGALLAADIAFLFSISEKPQRHRGGLTWPHSVRIARSVAINSGYISAAEREKLPRGRSGRPVKISDSILLEVARRLREARAANGGAGNITSICTEMAAESGQPWSGCKAKSLSEAWHKRGKKLSAS